ncbi:CDP-6-deoxy-delta-3%2C4-glucoseen reductase [Bordetella ansorpii]|uniref:CDP-6-deoxy-delta-3,4-glucoseen reductase n=1 Tax=Bordetella ansorpii TaxID=288768 RepID=A0A157QXL1_9BORD|nr:2Fe-2S iron-sulfur cluster-binding protein [Bordetella ansorpii]SAI50437.1 CDP-6-deoxy-delta-3%2C4-glucoseen reductase [Bordetella ansorpii]
MEYRVQVIESGAEFTVNPDETVLEAALRSGAKMPHECTFGACGTCRVHVLQGQVRYDEPPMGLTDEEGSQGYALACQARPCSDLQLSAPGSRMVFAEPRRVAASVADVTALCEGVTRLRLALPEDLDLDYRAGQYMNVWLDDDAPRSFSMATAPAGNLVEFHIRGISGGRFTDGMLRALKPGDRLDVEIPLGVFCLHEDDWRPMILAATGTGIAPLRAILESLLDDEDCPPVTLYWGMRTQADLYCLQELESWRGRIHELQVVPVLSRAGEPWTGRRGYVQDAIAQDHADLSEHALYLCGSPAMIQDVTALAAQRGADLNYVYADSFTFQHPMALA